MPLLRFEARNEFASGDPQLYRNASKPDDPKAVLDGVAVAGLVGILRQLGDLAEFAAEMFHGLQEEVTSTAFRSHKLKLRVQNVEAALPPVEKAMLAQSSHIHFAYTSGCEWHPRIRNEKNHFVYSDLPRFVMDSYEECRGPPRLHLLDKFDTGGSGSCLKRYSDPAFFRRAAGSFVRLDAEKVRRRDKKARKIKKKRSLQRKGGSLRNGSISTQSCRSEMFEAAVNGRTSHASSSVDTVSKSDPGDHLCSSDSRTGSRHIECVSRPSSSVQPEKQESSGFSSSSFHPDDIRDPGFCGQQPAVSDDSFLLASAPGKIPPRSSCVTWDEKEEISKAKTQHYEKGEAPAILAADAIVGVQESGDTADIHNPKAVQFEDQNVTQRSSRVSLLDDVESGTDNYMDALNTIDTESENDLDYKTKQQMKQTESCIDDGREEDWLNGPCADISLDQVMASDPFLSVPSVGAATEHTPDDFQEPSTSDSGSKVEYAECDRSIDIAASEIQESLPGRGRKSPGKPQESHFTEFSRLEPINIWSNGGLLGLEPSKPPDFKTSDSAIQPETSTSDGDTRKPCGGLDACSSTPVSLGNGLPLATDFKSTHEEASHENDGCPSQNHFGLGQRLLANRFLKKISLLPSCEPDRANLSPQPGISDQKSRQTLVELQANYLTSSPPLEHMKISFQPTDEFEASKLKLKFPDADCCDESNRDNVFTSFQLVPENAAGRNDMEESDSDDDTFGRSSTYMSDDCVSRRSDTDSEQWEPSASAVPSIQSVPSSVKPREMGINGVCISPVGKTADGDNGVVLSLSDSMLDLPSFDVVQPPLEELDLDHFRSLRLQYTMTSSSLPPPLPPAQWCISKPTSDAFPSKVAPMTHQPKPPPAIELQTQPHSIPFTLTSKDEQKMNRPKEADHRPANGKARDENEDFLQQIRSKSFSLRRTSPAKTNLVEAPTANDRVTEILKKASAIRQAVESDVDEDDAWSDD